METELDQPPEGSLTPAEPQDQAAVEEASAPEVREGDLVVEGVLTGLQVYALRPVPGTGYAARRLRARTFRAAVLGEVMAQRVAQRLGLNLLVWTGCRFLLAGPAEPGWEEVLHSLQREFEAWLFQHLNPPGALECLLAGAICGDHRLPVEELEARRNGLRLQPLEGALRIGARWNEIGRAHV